jgi:hypothetical protein
MGQKFQCTRCGTQNQVGQRYCTGCRVHLYYTCTKCNTIVDPSFTFCPNCSTSLNWSFKPRASLLQQGQPATRQRFIDKYKARLIAAGVVVLIALAVAGYFANRTDLHSPLVFEGYNITQEPAAESEKYVTAPPGAQYSGNPPYKIGANQRFQLHNNANAADTSFAVLKDFIMTDPTDKAMYIPGIRQCGHFAQAVHNDAEQAGIKAAVVIVEFSDGTLHALNAFQTTDAGLVYIDCTGVIKSPNSLEEWLYSIVHPYGQDRVAYVEQGKDYGTIPLENAESPEYNYYTGYSKGWMLNELLQLSQPSVVKSVKIYW